MFSIPPSALDHLNALSPADHDPAHASAAAPPSAPTEPRLPPSVTVESSTFHTGRVITSLSATEKLVLESALHPDIPKQPVGEMSNQGLITYTIGAQHYFSSGHIPKQLPHQMIVSCHLDKAMSLDRVIVADMNNHIYCNALFERSIPLKDLSARRSSSVRAPASNPASPVLGGQGQTHHPRMLSLADMSQNTLAALDLCNQNHQILAMLAIDSVADSALNLQSGQGRDAYYATADGDLSVHARLNDQALHDIISIASPYANTVYLSVGPRVTTHPTASHSALVAASSSPAQWILRSSAPAANPYQVRRTRKPGATDQQIQEELRDSNNILRNESQIAEALSNRGLGVRSTRLTEALQNVRGPKLRPSASDAQIITELRRAGPKGCGTSRQSTESCRTRGTGRSGPKTATTIAGTGRWNRSTTRGLMNLAISHSDKTSSVWRC